MKIALRRLVPFALATLTTTGALADGVARPFDAARPRPFTMSLRGASASEAWVTMQPRAGGLLDEAVVDTASGCVVETIPPFTEVARLGRVGGADPFARGTAADATKQAESLVADNHVKGDIVRFVAAGRRFGRRSLGYGTFSADDVAFSSDGATIALDSAEAVFRSHDGGKTFDRLDANMSRYPHVTADGKWVLYERCSDPGRRNQSCPAASREVRVVSADNSTPPRTIAIGNALLRGLDPSGQKLLVVRYDIPNEVTAMHIDPVTGTFTRAFGVPSAPLPPNRFHDIVASERTGAFGLFDDNDRQPFNALTVISMSDGHVVQKLTVRNEMGTEIDDDSGRIMWQTFPDDHAWAKSPSGAIKDLGMGDPLGWVPGGRALVFNATYAGGRRVEEPAATVGAVACKIVRVTTVR